MARFHPYRRRHDGRVVAFFLSLVTGIALFGAPSTALAKVGVGPDHSTLAMDASTPVRGYWRTTPPTGIGSPFCGGIYYIANVLQFKECVYANSVTGGAWVRTGLSVKNVTATSRWITGYTEAVVSGQLKQRTDCGNLLLGAGVTAWCISVPRDFVLDGGYAYGRGWVKDYSRNLSGLAYSGPVYRP